MTEIGEATAGDQHPICGKFLAAQQRDLDAKTLPTCVTGSRTSVAPSISAARELACTKLRGLT